QEPVETHRAAIRDRAHTKCLFRNDTISRFRNGQAPPPRAGGMSPRPRKVSDEELFAATHAMMARVGPGELTLAAIAREAGVTAAVLVQRFGSKRRLLLALARRAAGASGALVADLRRHHPSPLAALRAYAACMAQLAASPAALARSLAYLEIDLTDADFRK